MPNFETYERSTSEPGNAPYVSITAHAEIKLSKSAGQLLGFPRLVELHFDRDARIVGMTPTAKPSGIPLRVLRQEGIGGHGHTIASTDAEPFLDRYGIDHSVTRQYPAYLADGVLCLDLDRS